MNNKLIPHCKRLSQVGKNVHSQLVRPTVWFKHVSGINAKTRNNFSNNYKLEFRSVPLNTNTSMGIGNLQNGSEREKKGSNTHGAK